MGRRLNGDAWDQASAAARLDKLVDPARPPEGELSGGQRAQVALTIALAKRPDLVVLDEPVASLDPLARRTFLSELMGEVADRELTVLLSSHLIADLEHRCDYLVILSDSRVQVLGDVDDLLTTHRVLVGPADAPPPAGVRDRISRSTGRQRTLVVRTDRVAAPTPGWDAEPISLEDLVLAYLGEPDGGHPSRAGGSGVIWLAWRRRRGAVIATGVALAVAAALMFVTGSSMWSAFRGEGLAVVHRRAARRAVRAGMRVDARTRRRRSRRGTSTCGCWGWCPSRSCRW